MLFIATVTLSHYLFIIPLMLLSVFLILVILVQRGRGGGLTGALGGMGGQSAFGTKAGDLFTRITIVVAAIWVLLSMASLKVLNQYSGTANLDSSQRGQAFPTKTGEGGLLPSATKSDGTATGTTPEAGPADEKASATPASPASSTPSSAPSETKGNEPAGPSESSKAADAAKP